jgi:diacylglycerol kinase (ATP)
MSTSSPDPVNPQKSRTGLSRVLHAGGYSWLASRPAGMKKHFSKKPSVLLS